MNKTENGEQETEDGERKTEPNGKPFRFGVVLLAAGASARMGTPKQLLEIGGRALVARAAEAALASAAWPVVVVLGAHAGKIRPALARLPVLITENPAWAEGMASSLRAGLGTLRTFSRALDGALVAVADQPAFSADAVARLVAARHESGRSIAAARYAGRLGVPALFGRPHFAALAALTGEEGARKFLAERADDTAAVELPEMATDLDTPADVAAWRGPANPA